MSFSLTELRVLSGLAAGKTLGAIARELYLGQPGLSKMLRAAEQRAGFALVEQDGRRLRLTPAGLEVARAAAPILTQVDDLDHVVEGIRAGTHGPLRVVSSRVAGSYVLPAIIGAFLNEYPDVRVSLEAVSYQNVGQELLAHVGDFSVSPPLAQPAGLVHEWLYDDPIVFFVGASSPLAAEPAVTWDQLQALTFVGPFTDVYWDHFWSELARRGFPSERRLALRAAEGVKRLVEAGAGVGVLFGCAVREELASGRLRRLPLAEPSVTQPVYLIHRSTAPLTPTARRFRAFLLARLRANQFPQE